MADQTILIMNENYENNLYTCHGKTTHSAVHNALSKSANKAGSDCEHIDLQ